MEESLENISFLSNVGKPNKAKDGSSAGKHARRARSKKRASSKKGDSQKSMKNDAPQPQLRSIADVETTSETKAASQQQTESDLSVILASPLDITSISVPESSLLSENLAEITQERILDINSVLMKDIQELSQFVGANDDVEDVEVWNQSFLNRVTQQKSNCVLVSPHVVGVFSDEMKPSEAEVLANCSNAKVCVESLVVDLKKRALIAQSDVDIVMSGQLGRRSLLFRIATAILETDSQLAHNFNDALSVLRSFGCKNLDDECDADFSHGWTEIVLDTATSKPVMVEIRPAVIKLEKVDGSNRLCNVFHQLLAGSPDSCKASGSIEIDESGRVRAASADKQTANPVSRSDYYGFLNLCDSLKALGFTEQELDIVWNTCVGVLCLISPESESLVDMAFNLLGATKEEFTFGREKHKLVAQGIFQDMYDWIVFRINQHFSTVIANAVGQSQVTLRIFELAPNAQLSLSASASAQSFTPTQTLRRMLASQSRLELRGLCNIVARSGNETLSFVTLGYESDVTRSATPLKVALPVLRYSRSALLKTFPLTAKAPSLLFELMPFSTDDDVVLSEAQWLSLVRQELDRTIYLAKLAAAEDIDEQALLQAHSYIRTLSSVEPSSFPIVCDDIQLVEEQVNHLMTTAKEARSCSEAAACLSETSDCRTVGLALDILVQGLEHDWKYSTFKLLKNSVKMRLERARDSIEEDVCEAVHARFAKKSALIRASSGDQELQVIIQRLTSLASEGKSGFERARVHAQFSSKVSGDKDKTSRQTSASYCNRMVRVILNDRTQRDAFDLHRVSEAFLPKVREEVEFKKANPSSPGASRFSVLGRLKETPVKARVVTKRLTDISRESRRFLSHSAPKSRFHKAAENILANDSFFRKCYNSLIGIAGEGINQVTKELAVKILLQAVSSLLAEPIAFEASETRVWILDDLLTFVLEPFKSSSRLTEHRAMDRLAVLGVFLYLFDLCSPRASKDIKRQAIYTKMAMGVLLWLESPVTQCMPEDVKDRIREFLFGLDPVSSAQPSEMNRMDPAHYTRELWTSIHECFRVKGLMKQAAAAAAAAVPAASSEAKVEEQKTNETNSKQQTVVVGTPLADANKIAQNEKDHQNSDNDREEVPLPSPPKRYRTESERLMFEQQERWKQTHVNCVALYDYSDPDGDELYLTVTRGEILWIPLEGGKRNPLSNTRQWVWVERYWDDPNNPPCDSHGKPIKLEGYVPFEYVGFPGYEQN